LRPVASGGYATKAAMPGMAAARESFHDRLGRADDRNRRDPGAASLAQGWSVPEAALAPVDADMAEALQPLEARSLSTWQERAARPDRIAATRRMMEDEHLRDPRQRA
jgi:hypothetical protein